MARLIRPQPIVFRLSAPAPVDQVLVRERLMDVIKRRLERVTIANGYSCDAGLDVKEGRLVTLTPDTPSMNFWDGDETAEKEYRRELNTLSLTVEVYDKRGRDETSDNIARSARRMVADVRRAVAWNDDYSRVDQTLDKLADSVAYRASDLVLGLNPESWLGVVLGFEIKYYTILGNLYRNKE